MFRNIYRLMFAFIFITNANAQFEDNFDSYIAGQRLSCQNANNWTTWSFLPCDVTEDPMVSNTFAFSGSNSVLIVQNNDLVSDLGQLISGTWYMDFMLYIPNGKAGYFNTLADFAGTIGTSNWAMQAYLNVGGTGTIDAAGAASASFSYPYDAWFPVSIVINLTADLASLTINNVLVHTWQYSLGAFGAGSPLKIEANNFYGATANDEMYVDNYRVSDIPIPVELTSFTAIINPFGQAVLNWVTATEINNKGFEVERRIFDGSFFTLGFVEGSGTTTEERTYSYVDRNVNPGVYVYRLKQIDFDGHFEYSDEIELVVTPPLAFELKQNYPNPFNPGTKITFSLPVDSRVTLKIFDVLGQEIALLVNNNLSAGVHDYDFNAAELNSGVYLYRIEAVGVNGDKSVDVKKMILTK